MKYGLLVNKHNSNIGDDIQAYAEAQFLPRVDVMCNREHLDTFSYEGGNEPVALIMGAWFMWHKYNWPPAEQIIPLLVGYHHFDRNRDVAESSSYALPLYDEHYDGIGGQWFKDYGPVGCRDEYTLEVFEDHDIPAYFSGCVTLTLPKQKETPDKGTYVVLVDLNAEVEAKVREEIGDAYEVRRTTHTTDNIYVATWEERTARVEEYLTLYQNAKYVVTRRLHVALPCLAMGVPVMVIQSVRMNDPNRFEPYRDWLYYCRNNDFLKKGYPDFDFKNPPESNKPDYLPYRESMTKSMRDFVQFCEDNKDKPLSFFNKVSYTEEEKVAWQAKLRKKALFAAHEESKRLHKHVRATGAANAGGSGNAAAKGRQENYIKSNSGKFVRRQKWRALKRKIRRAINRLKK